MVKYNASNGGALLGLLRPYCVGLVPGRWAERELLEAGRWEAEGRASGSAKASVGNSVKAIREPGLFGGPAPR